jgi:hypothetical protein
VTRSRKGGTGAGGAFKRDQLAQEPMEKGQYLLAVAPFVEGDCNPNEGGVGPCPTFDGAVTDTANVLSAPHRRKRDY